MIELSTERLNEALTLLGETLTAAEEPPLALVVCGGSAILIQRFVERTTQDVDIIALLDDTGALVTPVPLPLTVQTAAASVGRLLGLKAGWLNTGPADQLKCGLPDGFKSRLVFQDFGESLRVYFAGRYDLIHLKLFAATDLGPGRHVDDLVALSPSNEEMLAAARWVLTQDAGDGFPVLVTEILEQLGYADVAAQL
jgi:hypothetical protein